MKKLIYKYDDSFESWVFTTEERAQENIDSSRAFEAKTWGEFKSILPSKDYEWIAEILIERQFEDKVEDDESFEPSDDEPFTEGDWILDADYPGYLVYENVDHLPTHIIEKHAEEVITMHDGIYYKLALGIIGSLIKDLNVSGISAEHRPDLDFR